MKRMCVAAVLCALLCGCAAAPAGEEGGQKRYEASFLTLFDTVTTMVGYADSAAEELDGATGATERNPLDEQVTYVTAE